MENIHKKQPQCHGRAISGLEVSISLHHNNFIYVILRIGAAGGRSHATMAATKILIAARHAGGPAPEAERDQLGAP
jgi:hypothetical protein